MMTSVVQVGLQFVQFDLVETDNCHSDYVDVYENGPGDTLLGSFCGSNIPSNITVGNKLWIKFNSGATTTATGGGFIAEYNLQHGNQLTGQQGEIASPMYPHLFTYGASTFEWTVTVAQNMLIEITFTNFELERSAYSDENCNVYLSVSNI